MNTAVNLTFPRRGGRFPDAFAAEGFSSLCALVFGFAGAHLSRAQEATSANLPDQFQTGEMIQIQKPKKKKAESTSQTVATAPKQDTAPVPEQTPAAEEVPTQIAPAAEKKAEPNRSTASMPPSQKPATPTEQAASCGRVAEVVAVPAEKKHSTRKRPRPAVQPEAASISAPVPMSLSVAQSMAITAPLPDVLVRSETPQPHRKRCLRA